MVKTATGPQRRGATEAPTKTKAPRAPSAYNLFMKERLKPYREANPGTSNKDAMKAIAAQWRDAPENPNRGLDPKARTRKAPKAKKVSEETATSEPEPASDD
ncbi:hypothetical protein NM688_g7467 [Phlebia brevispora]|uniref:Uncharacterized protein n=1 Tax=Phlebia brevispora TaxID=194682 RepID=A0ACC1S4X6_9APHY|nr:hypothetical protein NM688_g7467 [Phlebia brevispora]